MRSNVMYQPPQILGNLAHNKMATGQTVTC